MLAAESLGISSAPMKGFDRSAVKSAFGVPDDHALWCLVALGYAADSKPFPDRFSLHEVCYEEHFGHPWTLASIAECGIDIETVPRDLMRVHCVMESREPLD
jgi:hypothetical protein